MSWYGEALSAWYAQNAQAQKQLGEGITGAASDIGNAIKTAQQNSQANQLSSQMANTQTPPRAGLVSLGSNPITGAINSLRPGTNTMGTAPIQATGGVPGLEMRMAVQKAQQEATGAGIENQLKQAQAGYYGAHADYMRQQPGLQKKEMQLQYRQQRDAQTDMEKNADTVPLLQKEVDDSYGKGAFQKFTAAFSQDPTGASMRGSINTQNGKQYWIPNPNGPLFSPNHPQSNSGFFGMGAGPGEIDPENTITMPSSAFQGYVSRFQRIQAAGGRYVPPAATPGAAPSPLPSGGSGGSAMTPQRISTPQQYAQLPSGSTYIDPSGVTRTKP